MTFKQKALALLTEHGMFPEQADEVLTLVMASPANNAMQHRWNDRVEDYPEIMLNILWLSVKREARDYIAKHCPEAWFRPLFEDNAEKANG